MNIVVTGSTGLIGSAVVATGTKKIPRAQFTKLSRFGLHGTTAVDLLCKDAEETLATIDFSHLVHTAAEIPSSMFGDSASKVAPSNLEMDNRIISLCKKKKAKLVYISSSSVYGFGSGPWSEDSPANPPGAYSQGKLDSEHRILSDLPKAVILRVSSPYGASQRTNTVLKIFIESALEGKNLNYNGTGQREQDFVASEDVANAVLLALKADSAAGVFNITGGSPISMRNLAELVLSCVPETKSRALASGLDDPQENYRPSFNLKRAESLLKWKPGVALRTGIENWISTKSKLELGG